MTKIQLFSDILNLPHDENTDIVGMSSLRTALPHVPESVLKQVFSDHGRNPEFQTAYGHLNLGTIRWRLQKLPASELALAGFIEDFERWPQSVAARAERFEQQGWKCIDVRERIQQHWENNGTWETPPVLLSGSLVHAPQKWRLVEGHTRIGLLRGLIQYHVISNDSLHEAWCGTHHGTLP